MPVEACVESAPSEPNYHWYDPRYWIRSILMLEDTPHSIALGAAMGMWIAFTPTVGIQQPIFLLLAACCAPFFRFNIPIGLMAIYISNPVTMAPIYWFNYKVGTLFVEGNVTYRGMVHQLNHLYREFRVSETGTWGGYFNDVWIFTWGVCELISTMGWALVIGSIVVSTVLAIPTYPIIYAMVSRYQRKILGHEKEPEHPHVIHHTGYDEIEDTCLTHGPQTVNTPAHSLTIEISASGSHPTQISTQNGIELDKSASSYAINAKP
jgi:hypothetical protein